MPIRTIVLLCSLVNIGIVAAMPADPARAEAVGYTYIGVVASISDEKGLLGSAVALADPFALAAWFAAEEPDGNPDPLWGVYESSALASRFSFSLPGLALASPSATAAVADNLPAPPPNAPLLDLFRLESTFDTIALGRHFAFFVQLLMIDETATAFSSTALPAGGLAATPNPARFAAAAQLIITGGVVGEPGQFTIIAAVTGVPAPGATALAALVAAPLLARRRRPMHAA